MRRLDGPVGHGRVDPEGPRVPVGEHGDGQVVLLVHPLDEAPGRPGGLSGQVNQHAVVLLGEAVLDQPGVHTSCLYRHDELRVARVDLECVLLDLVGHREPRLRHIVDAVHGLHALLGHGGEVHVPVDVGPGLLRAELEVLPHAVGDRLQVLRQQVALVLGVELGVVPALGDVVHLPQGGGLVLADHLVDEVRRVDGPEHHDRPVDGLGGARRLQVAVLPDAVLRVELDVPLGPERELHRGDHPAVQLVVDLLDHAGEAVLRQLLPVIRHQGPLPPASPLPRRPPRSRPRRSGRSPCP